MVDVALTASPAARARFGWSDAPELSVVIVTYGTGSVLDRAIVDLAAAIAADGLDAEVIVVDNPHPVRGSWAGDRLRLTTSGVRLVRATENLSFGGGNNLGVSLCRASLVCLLNPDVFVRPGDLRRLVEAARRHDGDIVAPAMLWPDGTVQEYGFRLLADGSTRAVEEPTDDGYDYCSAACWVLPSALFADLGGFDEAFHPAYYEDVDFVLRARARGRAIHLVPDVKVIHAAHSVLTSGWAEAIPDVSRQRAVFVERWAEVLAGRPGRVVLLRCRLARADAGPPTP